MAHAVALSVGIYSIDTPADDNNQHYNNK